MRIPAWTDSSSSVRINGHALDAAGTPGSYLTITRVWRAGDRVELLMPMRLTVEPLPDEPTLKAFLYGPLVLAGQFAKGDLLGDLMHNQGPELEEATKVEVPALSAKNQRLEEWIKPVPGQGG